MKQPIIIIGIGEMGGVFARAFLRLGHPVYPLNRDEEMQALAQQLPDPLLVLCAVGEKALAGVLEGLPDGWRDRLVLLQNELLPRDWEGHKLQSPTVISVWFEKKPGKDPKVIIPSPAFGPHAEPLREALDQLSIPVSVLESEEALLQQLVLKNLYILTSNIAGLKVGGDVGTLWSEHHALAEAVADDVLAIQQCLVGKPLERAALLDELGSTFAADPQHQCMGRSAPARLERALELAANNGLQVPALHEIAQQRKG